MRLAVARGDSLTLPAQPPQTTGSAMFGTLAHCHYSDRSELAIALRSNHNPIARPRVALAAALLSSIPGRMPTCFPSLPLHTSHSMYPRRGLHRHRGIAHQLDRK